MTTPFTPVPPTRATGTGAPAADMDNTALELAAMGGTYNVMNAAYAGGADPTGVADSTAAINAALAAASPGQTVTMPSPGIYKTSAPLNVPTLVGLAAAAAPWTDPQANYGVGGVALGGAVIKPTGAFSGTSVIYLGKSGGTQVGGQSLSGFSIDGSSLPASVHGINAASVAAVKMRDVVVSNVTGNGLNAVGTTPDFTPPDGWHVSGCKFINCTGWGIYAVGFSDSWFIGGLCSNNGSGGVSITNPGETRFIGWRCNNNGSVPGWSLAGNSGYTAGVTYLIGCDGNFNGTGYAVSGTGTGTFAFTNCGAHGNTTAATSVAGTNQVTGLPSAAGQLPWTFPPGNIPDPVLGMVAWNFPSALASSSTPALTSGTVYVMRIPMYMVPATVTNIVAGVTTAGGTLTGSECFAALFDNTGTRIGVTADQSAVWNSTGLKSMALVSGPFTGTWPYVYAAILSNGTTNPIFARGAGAGTGASICNLNASAANLLAATNGTTQTTMPGSLTYSSNSGTNGQMIWVGLS